VVGPRPVRDRRVGCDAARGASRARGRRAARGARRRHGAGLCLSPVRHGLRSRHRVRRDDRRARRRARAARLSGGGGAVTAPLPGGTPLLELRGVSAGYGPYRALFDVSLEVAEASTVALLGPNGAGKTTVARLCSGLVRPTAGRVVFAGAEITGRPPWRIARAGVSHAPEGRSVFASLTVEENLALELATLGRRGMASALARAYDLFPQLSGRRRQLAGTLSGGEQRMLMLARVLAHPPRLLVVDELSLGLAPVVLEQVYA